jgi:alcohol dehydrogenase class IV
MSHQIFANTYYIVGRGSIKCLSATKETRFGLITDFRALGEEILEKIKDMLKQAGKEIKVIADVKREPTTSDLEEPISAINEFKPDCILAIGGGSVIDTAKVLWMFYEHPDFTLEQAFKPFSVPKRGKKSRLIAVPTTSGTGSETTCVAVLVDKSSEKKRLIMSRELIPSMAIMDADFADTMPKKVAAYSGLDALAHALEAAVCKVSSPIVKTIGMAAALDIIEWLPVSVNGVDKDKVSRAREVMHNASTLAGMAINNSCTGLSHAMDQIGPLFGLPHGLICGILLPYTTELCCPIEEYSSIARRLGFSGSDDELCKNLVKKLVRLNRTIGIPLNLKDAGISLSDIEKNMDQLVNSAMSSAAANLSPAEFNQNRFIEAFLKAYHGDLLNID